MNIAFDAMLGILRLTIEGPWPSGAAQHRLLETLDDRKIPPTASALVDLRGVEAGSEPRYADLLRQLPADRLGGLRRRAYLTREGTQYSVARMIQAMTSEGFEMEVFTDEIAALQWLKAPPQQQ